MVALNIICARKNISFKYQLWSEVQEAQRVITFLFRIHRMAILKLSYDDTKLSHKKKQCVANRVMKDQENILKFSIYMIPFND